MFIRDQAPLLVASSSSKLKHGLVMLAYYETKGDKGQARRAGAKDRHEGQARRTGAKDRREGQARRTGAKDRREGQARRIGAKDKKP
jgi:hypothetical protein